MSRWGEVGREFAKIPGDVARHQVGAIYEDGFDAASKIFLDLVAQKVDALMSDMKTRELSRPEQLLLGSLTELKSEAEQSLRAYLDGPPVGD